MKEIKIYIIYQNLNNNFDGSSYGCGSGSGCGNGCGSGYGYAYGNGCGSGCGNGSGDGYGSDYGHGDGSSFGNGNGSGYGHSDGSGSGDGYGNGINYLNNMYIAKIFGAYYEIIGQLNDSICRNLHPSHYKFIDKEFVKEVTNLESLRILRDKIGLQKYLSLFDAKLIAEEKDLQGNLMKLYRYNEKEIQVIILEVICPSTGRMYHLYPPNQNAITCIEAKKSTFENKNLTYRQGDVGLVNLNDLQIAYPLSET